VWAPPVGDINRTLNYSSYSHAGFMVLVFFVKLNFAHLLKANRQTDL